MALNANVEWTVKNTFLDVVEDGVPAAAKRSNSLPRSFKPAEAIACVAILAVASDASTMDSDDCCTDHEDVGGCSSCDSDSEPHTDQTTSVKACGDNDDSCSESHDAESTVASEKESSPKMVLCLSKTILCLNESVNAASLTKLNSKARIFEPKNFLPRDMKSVVAAAHASLSASPCILSARVKEGALGTPTTIVGTCPKGTLGSYDVQKTLSVVKMALLDAAANSENTYVIGYQVKPFEDMGISGFTLKLGSVPDAQADGTCWDSYQKGFCPRRSTCRWCHPTEKDFAQVIITLKEVGSPASWCR
jgi:hypothetical protein